jgi:hypothetical protein
VKFVAPTFRSRRNVTRLGKLGVVIDRTDLELRNCFNRREQLRHRAVEPDVECGDPIDRSRGGIRLQAADRDLVVAVPLDTGNQRGHGERAGVVGSAEVKGQFVDVATRFGVGNGRGIPW